MPNKLTDTEIKKALKICSTKGVSCKECPAFVKVDRSNCKQVLLGALNIINRQETLIEKLEKVEHYADKTIATQKAEIEQLTKDKENFAYSLANAVGQKMTVKAEAYKEFADKIKKWKYQSSDWSHGEHPFVIEESDIDEVLNELVGDENVD